MSEETKINIPWEKIPRSMKIVSIKSMLYVIATFVQWIIGIAGLITLIFVDNIQSVLFGFTSVLAAIQMLKIFVLRPSESELKNVSNFAKKYKESL